MGVSTKQEDYLKFLFEMSDDFCVLPTFIIQSGLSSTVLTGVEGLNIDPTMVVKHKIEKHSCV